MKQVDNQWQIKPNFDKALMLAQRELSVLVFDSVNLEGIAMTLPEIQTILGGVTVGGYKIVEQQIAINQGKAWAFLFASLKKGDFSISIDYMKRLHDISTHQEDLSSEEFHKIGSTIPDANSCSSSPKILHRLFEEMIYKSQLIEDVYDRAIFVYLELAKNRFFNDVNMKIGQFMMSGILLEKGFPIISIPVLRQQEFKQLMPNFFENGDTSAMNVFIRSCMNQTYIKIMNEDQI